MFTEEENEDLFIQKFYQFLDEHRHEMTGQTATHTLGHTFIVFCGKSLDHLEN